MRLTKDQKFELANKVSNQILNMVKSDYTGSLVIHFSKGQIMSEDKKKFNELFDLISRIQAKDIK